MLNKLPDCLPKYEGKGKVLRVKQGYNPNSSSLGSIVFSFPAAMLAVPVLLSTTAALIYTKVLNKKNSDKALNNKK